MVGLPPSLLSLGGLKPAYGCCCTSRNDSLPPVISHTSELSALVPVSLIPLFQDSLDVVCYQAVHTSS